MNYNNSTEAYLRSAAKIGIRQHGRSRELFDLSGWLPLWKPVAKILLLILPVVLCIHMFVVSAITSVDLSIVNVGDQRHELMDKNIALLASKARLWSPASMEQLAAEKLALYSSSEDQVGRFNRRTGTFIYP
ncbi:hypothetical protein FCL47_14730 [Desulfopila sp. IMCC35006]|uniref:hypothetical protein n=1 Tax=Desulfopila sp. IMCC35006 TaxID=2569542 RepID=UPI0010AD6105|nr:hypothetical protein [Desulfopila sp. IMCC35006]TKB25304.1 hypothetical protein FCL47_14730 [Desulfopila sp. IMCC35006]